MKKLGITACMLLALSSTAALADNHTSGIVQVFGCSLNDGRSMLDAREILRDLAANAAASENSDPRFGMFVWLPVRGASDADFVFGVLNSDLRTMAAGSAAFAATEFGQDLQERMRSTADCESGIMASNQIADGNIGMTADTEIDAIVETFRCDIRDGSDAGDINAAIKNWQNGLESIESEALDNYDAYVWWPIRGGPGNDFYWVGNAPSMEAWGNGLQDYMDSEAGQKAQTRFDAHSRCVSNLWAGYWLYAPEEF